MRVNATQIQVDAAGLIGGDGLAPTQIMQTAPNTPAGGGSGGGNGGSGGQGRYQDLVGSPPSYGSLYHPKEYGGNGGDGGGSVSDLNCNLHETHSGGRGGCIVELFSKDVVLDGEIKCRGLSGSGPRAGGGAGGSVYIEVDTISGLGTISVQGGDVPPGIITCGGGGGAGGRAAIHYNEDNFIGELHSHGGSGGFECGAAGTVLWRDVVNDKDVLHADNKHVCIPNTPEVAFGQLSDAHRGEHSCQTWLFDPLYTHIHNFSTLHLAGDAQLALYRRNVDVFDQYINIYKTTGDKSGMFHIGPHQYLFADLPIDSPELEFGLKITPGGTMRTEALLFVQGITIELEGTLEGAENLIIGPNGIVIIKLVIHKLFQIILITVKRKIFALPSFCPFAKNFCFDWF